MEPSQVVYIVLVPVDCCAAVLVPVLAAAVDAGPVLAAGQTPLNGRLGYLNFIRTKIGQIEWN